ncbi:thiol-disulfide oxidoreductase [Flavobacterium magnum]|uniref:Thiol-disulfide oxidoreductase n=1 Tax=Flavobacterium magnum TaxID=2162713 RepID=A0A2S0RFD3_9FLAO|nr:DCC1-like thiol-disulfide oxidoreductase family protein [Flavobacterium magnum]AWA30647.1 thiol-disulfide oxidoreductase [Flavobacterium magnum]
MNLPTGKKIILFDGVCNLCNRMVRYVIAHDKRDVFRFVPLQSDLGREILTHIGIDGSHFDSVVLYEPGKAYFRKSAAAIEIAKEFGGLFHLSAIFKLIPAPLRNSLYDYIAKNRYKRYGKQDRCMVPTPELRAKFL